MTSAGIDDRVSAMLAQWRERLDKAPAWGLLLLDENVRHLAYWADSPYAHPDLRAEVAAFMEEWDRTVSTIRATLNAQPPPDP